MAEQAVPNGADSELPNEYSRWVNKDVLNNDNEVRILSKEDVTRSRTWMLVRLVSGLAIMMIGATPAITGDLPGLARAALLVGGLTLALFSYPRILRFIFGLVGDNPMSSHGNAVQVRRRSRRRRRSRNFDKWSKVYRFLK